MAVRGTLKNLVELADGSVVTDDLADFSFEGVEFDSRLISGGELFVALPGEEGVHGHGYINSAFERGAALALVECREAAEQSSEPGRCAVVDSTIDGFWTLASWWRDQFELPVAAVTGSVGKTTTKELVAAILVGESRGVYSQKSYNNHIGVPYTLCQLSSEHRWCVLEMGMNHPGEIEPLSKMAKPSSALITKIAPVHMHVFDSLDQVADAKCEIFAGLSDGGAICLNGDDAVLREAAERAGVAMDAVRTFGESADCAVQIREVKSLGLSGLQMVLQVDNERINISTPLIGQHNVYNIAAAVLVARTLVPDLAAESIIGALQRFTPAPMRLNVRPLSSGQQIVDDSYNSNPEAVLALLELAKSLLSEGRSVGFVLGDMLELGERAEELHREVADAVVKVKPAFVVGVGELAKVFVSRAEEESIVAFQAESPEAAAHVVRKLNSDIVCVKASRGIGLDRTVQTLVNSVGEDLSAL